MASHGSPTPTHIRWHILALVMAVCFISHFNRVSMSVAGTDRIMADHAISPTRMGNIYSAFLLIYSLCMIPGGLFIDRFGPRRALMLVGFGSALFGALTGVVGLVLTGPALWLGLICVRGTMGMVSAPLHPASARLVGNWFPPIQRNLANGLVTGAAVCGVALTYTAFGTSMRWVGWQAAFIASAVATAGLAWLWTFYVTDHPAEHPLVKAAQPREVVASTAGLAAFTGPRAHWKALLRRPNLLLLTLSYAAVGYFQYLFVYWMQYYFDQILQLGSETSKQLAGIPQIAMALTMPVGGWLADRLSQRVGLRSGRAIVAGAGMVLSAVFLGLGVVAGDKFWIVTWFTLALGVLGASEGPFWATAVDIGGRSGGTAAAICNTGGNLGGLLAPTITPWVSGYMGWPWGIGLGGLICFLGALCWCGIDPKPCDEDSPPAAQPS